MTSGKWGGGLWVYAAPRDELVYQPRPLITLPAELEECGEHAAGGKNADTSLCFSSGAPRSKLPFLGVLDVKMLMATIDKKICKSWPHLRVAMMININQSCGRYGAGHFWVW